VRKKWWAGTGL